MSNSLKCCRCRYEWESRIDALPRNCPKCKSPLWNKPKASLKLAAKAHASVYSAIQSGKLSKLPCAVCGNEKAVAHHEDYKKPLDVVWYCRSHHSKRHQEIGGPLKQTIPLIEIPLELHLKLKMLALQKKTTLKVLVEDLLTSAVKK